jgi:hypothetical protein
MNNKACFSDRFLRKTGVVGLGNAYCIGLFLLVFHLAATTQAQFTCKTNNGGTITITGYTGSGGAVTIPSSIDGHSVISIGSLAFVDCSSLTSVTIPDGVTNIGSSAFAHCTSLTNVSIPRSVYDIYDYAFWSCTSLTTIDFPTNASPVIWNSAFANCTSLASVTLSGSYGNYDGLGDGAFANCTALTNVTITGRPPIGDHAFYFCTNLLAVYYGDYRVRQLGSSVFTGDKHATFYYLPSADYWSNSVGGLPTKPWQPRLTQTVNSAPDRQTNGFGFNIEWARLTTVVVQATTNLANPTWLPLKTIPLYYGPVFFRDEEWKNYPARFYRVLGQ